MEFVCDSLAYKQQELSKSPVCIIKRNVLLQTLNFLHFTLCKIRISKSTSSFPDRKDQYLVKFCRLFISFCNVRGTEH